MESLKGKIVFITGASSGIGKACAEEFAKAGSNIIITARRKDVIDRLSGELRKKYKVNVLSIRLDVSIQSDVKKVCGSLPEEWKDVDILINNAGLVRGLNRIYEDSIEGWEEMIDTNIKGLLYVTRQIASRMVVRKSGHIINIGSISGHEVYPGGGVYCATKHAVEALTKSMRIDMLDKNIRVTVIDPGMVETEFSQVRFYGDGEKAGKVYQGLTPLSAEDVAEAVIFAANRPKHVNINQIIIMPAAQANTTMVYRQT